QPNILILRRGRNVVPWRIEERKQEVRHLALLFTWELLDQQRYLTKGILAVGVRIIALQGLLEEGLPLLLRYKSTRLHISQTLFYCPPVFLTERFEQVMLFLNLIQRQK